MYERGKQFFKNFYCHYFYVNRTHLLWLIIRIHHECESGREKSISRITDCHHEACRVMANVDHEGRIFLYHPHTNNGFFSCLPLNTSFDIGKTCKRLPENLEYAKLRHGDVA